MQVLSAGAHAQSARVRWGPTPIEVVLERRGDVTMYDVQDVARNRYAREIRVLDAQKEIIQNIANPFRVRAITVSVDDNHEVTGNAAFTDTFPCARIVNLPTGVGKTLLTTLGVQHFLRDPANRAKIRDDFRTFLETHFTVRTARGTLVNTLPRPVTDYAVLHNVVLVFSPKHLVGHWRDTFAANVMSGVHVFPHGDTYILPTTFDVERVRASPEDIFVYIVHPGNYKNYIQHTVGVAVFDEADSQRFVVPEGRTAPVAMYNLFVTATPSELKRCFRYGMHGTHNGTVDIVDTLMHFHAGHEMDRLNYHAEAFGMQVCYDHTRIIEDVARRIPDMHSFTVRTRVGWARTLGVAANDMQDLRATISTLERSLDITFYGSTIEELQNQLRENIARLEAIENPAPAIRSKLARLTDTLRRVQEIEPFCGICFEEFSSSSQMSISSCCGFFLCSGCKERLRTCAKCRNPNVTYIVQGRGARPVPAAAPAAAPSAPAAPSVPVVPASLQDFLRVFDFTRVDQRTALDEIMRVARATGLTHVIIAGAGVDHWPGFGPTMDTYHGFKVVRPSGHAMETRAPRTARRLDQTLRRYCQGGEPSVLVLDSHVEDAVELTGIDAGVTDLIVQIGTEASGSAYTQLAGRAMRFGRKPTNPVRVILQ